MAEKNELTKTLLTAKDLVEMGEEGEFCELVDGELVRMSPSFLPEARVVRTTLLLLGTFVLQHRLGEIFGPDSRLRADTASRAGPRCVVRER